MEQVIARVIHDLFGLETKVELTRPDEQFGDYATNVALQLAGKLGKSPRDVAQHIADALHKELGDEIKRVSVAGPGFINLALSDGAMLDAAKRSVATAPDMYKEEVIVAEYGDPNPFKILHAGHLYTAVVGDAIANLMQLAGGDVHRVNYGGDVGLHVGKAMWAILRDLGGENPDKLNNIPEADRASWMTKRYVEGNTAYEEDEQAKQQIVDLNKRVYQLHESGDHDSPFARIYWTCRQWSYDYFDYFYGRMGIKFEKYYPESEGAALGLETVRKHLQDGVYEQSDGAVVYRGEPHGLHTRVFITREGLPTYEAKDVGLIMGKWRDYHFDKSVIITDNGQADYMKVVVKSIEQFMPELASRTTHLTHGVLKLAGGIKMSARKGNVLLAVDILDAAAEATEKSRGHADEQSSLAAVKYAFLKQRIGGDIIYDPAESVSMEGNSGPYIQYAHARARSILAKASAQPAASSELDSLERTLARKISEYPDAVQKAVHELMPHNICTYLYELAQTFNRFYEKSRVVGDEREAIRLQLVGLYADVLKHGLGLLGMPAPERL